MSLLPTGLSNLFDVESPSQNMTCVRAIYIQYLHKWEEFLWYSHQNLLSGLSFGRLQRVPSCPVNLFAKWPREHLGRWEIYLLCRKACGCIESLEHDLGHLFSLNLGPTRWFAQQYRMLLWRYSEFVVKCVVPVIYQKLDHKRRGRYQVRRLY